MISILITHYNRPKALEQCVASFLAFKRGALPIEIIVTDDGSKKYVQDAIKKLPIDTLVTSEVNKGLTSNLNTGIKNCSGNYILYCQEDFIPKPELKALLPEMLEVLDSGKADMIRLKANYTFPKLNYLSDTIKLIPKFSWKNFYYNTFQYSDNPFITTKDFFDNYGYYLENTSGPYGENEYAIRIMKSKAKIAIVNKYLFKNVENVASVIQLEGIRKKRKILKKLRLHKLIRALRLHLEFLLYNPKKRVLLTIKNKRID
jgi:glycosyltransferase involved in cell wall biosynthesis|tara:strand:- start:291584 stop:292363 length:780 start_codon:yes stop_codon:yes gene_type:complete